MSKISLFAKAAGTVIATAIPLLTALRENPQVAEGIDKAVGKLKQASNSNNPKLRFDAKIAAIEVAADAVEETFPHAREPEGWRRAAKALRTRGELAWNANAGRDRRKAMKALNTETSELLQAVNARLAELQDQEPPAIDGAV